MRAAAFISPPQQTRFGSSSTTTDLLVLSSMALNLQTIKTLLILQAPRQILAPRSRLRRSPQASFMTMARVARLAVAKMRLAMVAILRSVAALFRSPRPRNNLIPTIAGGPESSSIVVTPIFTEPSPSSTGPLPTWIIEGSGTGGTSGGSGGTTGANSVVNQASGGLVINVVYDPGVSNAPAAFTADVQSVVNYYESHFSNPITITIDVGYGEVDGQSLGSGALGESITYFGQVSYSQLQSALVANLNANGELHRRGNFAGDRSGQWAVVGIDRRS